jgi:ketopantoate reductase
LETDSSMDQNIWFKIFLECCHKTYQQVYFSDNQEISRLS